MKNIILLVAMILFFKAHAADENKKVYSEAEFKEKVQKEVLDKVTKIKRKSIAQLTKELLEKENKLDEYERKLKQREEQIKIGEQTLAKKIMQVEADQKKIIGCVDENKRGQARRVKQMVSVISNMKPAKAAEILSVQDAQVSLKILEQIDPTRMSKIFNLMDKEVSARLQKQYLNMQQ
jgi:flagellar motility protein MotE (MotC chaperone)